MICVYLLTLLSDLSIGCRNFILKLIPTRELLNNYDFCGPRFWLYNMRVSNLHRCARQTIGEPKSRAYIGIYTHSIVLNTRKLTNNVLYLMYLNTIQYVDDYDH